jgi:galacturan 1,4-alpha-galacturonidase
LAYPSKLSISDVHFINVTGTSSGAEKQLVADLECSSMCYNITATGTRLAPPSGVPQYTCKNIASTSQVCA